MDNFFKERLISLVPVPMMCQSAVAGVNLWRREAQNAQSFYVAHPMVSFVVSGAKRTVAGGIETVYREGEFLVVGATMPGHCRVLSIEREEPFLSLSVDLDMGLLRKCFFELGKTFEGTEAVEAVFSGEIDGEMQEALRHLISVLSRPEHAGFIGPLIVEELHFLLAASEVGPKLRQLLEANTVSSRILGVVEQIQKDCAVVLDPEVMARSVGMSVSVFYRNFKRTTGMSPLQFQKRTRLFRAQELMLMNQERVSTAAHAVGYDDLSQFSREYKREFGLSPLKHVAQCGAQS